MYKTTLCTSNDTCDQSHTRMSKYRVYNQKRENKIQNFASQQQQKTTLKKNQKQKQTNKKQSKPNNK